MGVTKPDVLIVGGGVIGCAIAYYLAKEGAQVLLVEKDQIGSQASRAAAGTLTPLADASGPGPLLELSLTSLRLFPLLVQELKEESGIEIEYSPGGILYLSLGDEEEELKKSFVWQKDHGIKVKWLSSQEAHQLEPALSSDVQGGIHALEEAQVNPLRLTQAFAQAAANRGATIQLGGKATGLVTRDSRVIGVRLLDNELLAGHVILATGAWSGIWKEWLGPRVPVFPVRGQILAFQLMPVPLRHPIHAGVQGYLVPRPYGDILVGSTLEEVGFDLRVTAAAMAHLSNVAVRTVPALANATFREAWVSFRPGTPDGLPILGPLPDWQGLTLACGHYRKGILLSPITGQLISELLLKGSTTMSLEPFSPSRFSI